MTNSMKVRKRIITAQGSLQLMTALSAVLCHADATTQTDADFSEITYQDYLVIYDVTADFAEVIQKLATSIWTWQKITYLSPSQVLTFAAPILSGKEPPVDLAEHPSIVALREQIGPQNADEVYLVRNWQTSNQLIINAYARAIKIAYGDGIGYYFGQQRFQPKLQGLRLLQARLTAFVNKLRRQRYSLPIIPFDCAYLLLPHIFKEAPSMPFRIPDRRFLDFILRRSAEALPPEYRLSLATDRPLAILLPGNFAQTGWTTRQHEFDAYAETLLEKVNPRSSIVVKPHPRNTPRDIRFLRRTLQKHFADFRILEPPVSHIPMEVLLSDQLSTRQSVMILGFTTACIPLTFLYGIKCSIGFGRERLARYFPGTDEHMWENAVLLQEIVEQLSQQAV